MPIEIPESHRDLLEKKGFAHIATVGPKGEPQTTPVWFTWDGSQLMFSNTKGRQKFRNLSRDPRVAVSILDPDNPYRYLEIRGTATIEDDSDKVLIQELGHKYTGTDYPSPPEEQRVIIRITPEHVSHMG
ncbi:MAG TPA: PPOX class F420-dependent oxidoreductase [Actinomycetota bacterium]|nr:PPOX class F420-dependent oxidoreductase [Actinomycetota bacterium]